MLIFLRCSKIQEAVDVLLLKVLRFQICEADRS